MVKKNNQRKSNNRKLSGSKTRSKRVTIQNLPAETVKKYGDFKFKKIAKFFAKRYKDVKPDSRTTNFDDRAIDYLIDLRNRIRDEDVKRVNQYVAKKFYDGFIKSRSDSIKLTNNAVHETKTIRSRIDGTIYDRKVTNYLGIGFIMEFIKMFKQREGKSLILRVNHSLDDQDPTIFKSYYTVNEKLMKKLKKEYEGEGGYDEYKDVFESSGYISSIKVYYYERDNKNYKREGGFFKYKIKSDPNLNRLIKILKRYQIYDENYFESRGTEVNDENCLIHALELSGVEESKLTDLKLKCKSSMIPITEIKKFAEKNDLKIIVSTCKRNENLVYGKGEKIINLALVDDHYFIRDENIDFSIYSIKNYEKVKDQKEWWKITEGRKKGDKVYYERRPHKNNSFKLVCELIKTDLVERLRLDESTMCVPQIKKVGDALFDLNNNDDEYKKRNESRKLKDEDELYKMKVKSFNSMAAGVKNKEFVNNLKKLIFTDNKFNKHTINIPFDFETTTDGSAHKPYMISYGILENDEQIIKTKTKTGEDCGKKMLMDIAHHLLVYLNKKLGNLISLDFKGRKLLTGVLNRFFVITLIAHNITYDIQFLIKHVKDYNPIYRASNKICGGNMRFYGITLNLKDTYAITDCALGKFGEFFKFDIEKEILPYGIYTNKNIEKEYVSINKALKFLKDSDHDQFKRNIKKLKLHNPKNKDQYDHMEYAKYYCERDVEVMMKGYKTFKQWCKNDFNIDLDNFLTISSIADEILTSEGCYDGCYNINGIARYFIQKTNAGGRCMTRQNKKYNITDELNDFDGVSLYPSAINRLANELGGYLKGKPKMLEKNMLNLKQLNKFDGYFVTIKIKIDKLRKERDFPILSYVNDKGIRTYTNKVPKDNNFQVNKITLEDLMKFHDLREKDFEITEGYYFDEGRNSKCGDTIKKLFELRIKHKSDKNPIQALYKLCMNASYGKTIMKEQNDKIDFFNDKDSAYKFINRNYNNIKEFSKIYDCDKFIVKSVKAINDHFNASHIGSEILSMSKRIMNEVMCLAEDLGINIYYQDTDSMHIENDKIELLSKKFKKLYGRELIGKNMGQFHCDFESLFKDGKELKPLHTIKSIFLGKKAYMDVVKYEDGSTNNHFRMKGIPQDIVKIKAKEDFEGDVYKLYDYLHKGNPVTFDLLSNNKVRFKLETGKVMNVGEFVRTLLFIKDESEDDKIEEDPELVEEMINEIVNDDICALLLEI